MSFLSVGVMAAMPGVSCGAAGVASMHWFRRGLRLRDNAALRSALARARGSRGDSPAPFYAVYVLDGDCFQQRRCSARRAAFLVESLQVQRRRGAHPHRKAV